MTNRYILYHPYSKLSFLFSALHIGCWPKPPSDSAELKPLFRPGIRHFTRSVTAQKNRYVSWKPCWRIAWTLTPVTARLYERRPPPVGQSRLYKHSTMFAQHATWSGRWGTTLCWTAVSSANRRRPSCTPRALHDGCDASQSAKTLHFLISFLYCSSDCKGC